jgi:hypothetical protein
LKYKRKRSKYKTGDRWKSSAEKVRYMSWRKIIFELNKGKFGQSKHYVCMKCKKKRKTTRTMHAHHEWSWAKFPDKRFDRANGVVLCIKCHRRFHNKYKYDAVTEPKCLAEYLKK